MFDIISVSNDRLIAVVCSETNKIYLKGWVLRKANSSVVIMRKSHRIALLAFELALIVIFSLVPINLGAASLALTLLPVLVIALTQDFKTALFGGLIMGITSLIGAFTVGAASLTAPLFRNPLVSVLPRVCVPAIAWAVNRGLVKLCQKIMQKNKEYTADKAQAAESGEEQAKESADYRVAEESNASASDCSSSRAEKNSIKEKIKSDKNLSRPVRALIDAVSSALGVCGNTALVLGMIWLFYGGKTVGDSAITPEFMAGLVSLNFVIEVVVMTVLTPPIVYAIRKQQEKNG